MPKMYEIINDLCLSRGITVGKMCNILKISRGTLSDLNNDRTKELSLKTVRKIADYFGVSVDYIYGNEETNAMTPTIKPKDGVEISDDDLKFALFGDRNIDDDLLDEVKRFAQFAMEKKRLDKNR